MIVVVISFNKHGTLYNFMRQSFVHHCHCEERSDVAIRFPFCTGGLDGKAQKTQPLENGKLTKKAGDGSSLLF